MSYLDIFTDMLESATYARPVFHDNLKAKISRALKAQRAALTQHSLRRGAIQTLANSGVSAKHLLNFSGHKTMPKQQGAPVRSHLRTTPEIRKGPCLCVSISFSPQTF